LSDKDKDDIRHFVRAFRSLVADNQLGEFVSRIDLDEVEPWPVVGFHSHFMGATRMGDDENSSVTDSNGKVHGYDNLFISGPSLFASYGFANPFYPIVVFAIRVSRKIREKNH
jgi:choline dehydrogenase-like flavoprotein